MEPLRLVFIIVKYFEYGGLQRDMLRIAANCAQRGHEVHVLTAQWQGPKPQNLQVHEITLPRCRNHRRHALMAKHLGQWVTDHPVDAVVGFNRLPGLDVYYGGDPCFAAKLKKTWRYRFRWRSRYRTYLNLEAAVFGPDSQTNILLIAHLEKQKYIHHYGTDVSRIELLPPGIDLDRLTSRIPTQDQNASLRRELGVGDDDVMLLNVGSAFRTKGIDRIIRAMAALPSAQRNRSALVIVGRDKPESYKRLASRLGVGDRVIFTGGRTDVAGFYYAADLLVHPARSENTGTTLLEAMVCGLPVLATANCGYAHHITDADAGSICPDPFVQEQLDELLCQSIEPESRASWKDNALSYSRKTDLYSMVDRAADAIERRARAKGESES